MSQERHDGQGEIIPPEGLTNSEISVVEGLWEEHEAAEYELGITSSDESMCQGSVRNLAGSSQASSCVNPYHKTQVTNVSRALARRPQNPGRCQSNVFTDDFAKSVQRISGV